MSDTPVSDMAARKIGACAARWKDGSLAALEFANEADALLNPLRELERENAALALVMRRMLLHFPAALNGITTEEELRSAIDAARKEQP